MGIIIICSELTTSRIVKVNEQVYSASRDTKATEGNRNAWYSCTSSWPGKTVVFHRNSRNYFSICSEELRLKLISGMNSRLTNDFSGKNDFRAVCFWVGSQRALARRILPFLFISHVKRKYKCGTWFFLTPSTIDLPLYKERRWLNWIYTRILRRPNSE